MEASLQQIPLRDIRDHVGTPPSTKLRQSVRRMGVVQPVVLTLGTNEAGKNRYAIVDGNRRVAAARRAKLQSIPALVLGNLDEHEVSKLTLMLNGYRSANFLTEFWAIKSLARNNHSWEEIQQISGFAESSMEHRELLSSLNREIFVGLRNGRLLQTFASAIAKLPSSDQELLAHKFREQGRLRKWEIDEVARSSRRERMVPTPHTQTRAVETPVIYDIPVQTVEPVRWGNFAPSGFNEETKSPRSTVPLETPSDPALPNGQVESSTGSTQVVVPRPASPEVISVEPATAASSATAVTAPHQTEGSLGLDDQLSTLQMFREHLIAAARAAETLGMDRFDFLAQASKTWDSRGRESQARLLAPDAPEVVTSSPIAASRADIETSA